MAIKTTTVNYNVESTAPIDVRLVVNKLSDLTNTSVIPYPYVGMPVYVKETKEMYILTNANITETDAWKKLSDSIAVTTIVDKDTVSVTLADYKAPIVDLGHYYSWHDMSDDILKEGLADNPYIKLYVFTIGTNNSSGYVTQTINNNSVTNDNDNTEGDTTYQTFYFEGIVRSSIVKGQKTGNIRRLPTDNTRDEEHGWSLGSGIKIKFNFDENNSSVSLVASNRRQGIEYDRVTVPIVDTNNPGIMSINHYVNLQASNNTISQNANNVSIRFKGINGTTQDRTITAATTTKAGVMLPEDKEAINTFSANVVYLGQFTKIGDRKPWLVAGDEASKRKWARNKDIKIMKFDTVADAGEILTGLIIQTVNNAESANGITYQTMYFDGTVYKSQVIFNGHPDDKETMGTRQVPNNYSATINRHNGWSYADVGRIVYDETSREIRLFDANEIGTDVSESNKFNHCIDKVILPLASTTNAGLMSTGYVNQLTNANTKANKNETEINNIKIRLNSIEANGGSDTGTTIAPTVYTLDEEKLLALTTYSSSETVKDALTCTNTNNVLTQSDINNIFFKKAILCTNNGSTISIENSNNTKVYRWTAFDTKSKTLTEYIFTIFVGYNISSTSILYKVDAIDKKPITIFWVNGNLLKTLTTESTDEDIKNAITDPDTNYTLTDQDLINIAKSYCTLKNTVTGCNIQVEFGGQDYTFVWFTKPIANAAVSCNSIALHYDTSNNTFACTKNGQSKGIAYQNDLLTVNNNVTNLSKSLTNVSNDVNLNYKDILKLQSNKADLTQVQDLIAAAKESLFQDMWKAWGGSVVENSTIGTIDNSITLGSATIQISDSDRSVISFTGLDFGNIPENADVYMCTTYPDGTIETNYKADSWVVSGDTINITIYNHWDMLNNLTTGDSRIITYEPSGTIYTKNGASLKYDKALRIYNHKELIDEVVRYGVAFNYSTEYFSLNTIENIEYDEMQTILDNKQVFPYPKNIDNNTNGKPVNIRTNLIVYNNNSIVDARPSISNFIRNKNIEVVRLSPIESLPAPYNGVFPITPSNMVNVLSQCVKCHTLLGIVDLRSIPNSTRMFGLNAAENLKEFRFINLHSHIDISGIYNFSLESITFLVDNRMDTTEINITVHNNIYEKMTDETNSASDAAEWRALYTRAKKEKNINFIQPTSTTSILDSYDENSNENSIL